MCYEGMNVLPARQEEPMNAISRKVDKKKDIVILWRNALGKGRKACEILLRLDAPQA